MVSLCECLGRCLVSEPEFPSRIFHRRWDGQCNSLKPSVVTCVRLFTAEPQLLQLFFICGVGLLCFRGGALICYLLCCQISRFPITNWATVILAFWGQTFTRVLCLLLENQKNFGKLLSCLCCVGLAPSSSSLEPQIFIQLALFEVHS